MFGLRFKHAKDSAAYLEGEAIDPKLRYVVTWLWVMVLEPLVRLPGPPVLKSTARYLWITCLLRTPEENAAAGGHPMSAHLCGRGVDIRIKGWPQWLRDLVVQCLKTQFGAMVSAEDEGDHIHIGINYAFRTEGYEIK